MRVVCDSCGAIYKIPDHKLVKEVNRATCRKCGHRMLIRRAPEVADAHDEGRDDERTVIAHPGELERKAREALEASHKASARFERDDEATHIRPAAPRPPAPVDLSSTLPAAALPFPRPAALPLDATREPVVAPATAAVAPAAPAAPSARPSPRTGTGGYALAAAFGALLTAGIGVALVASGLVRVGDGGTTPSEPVAAVATAPSDAPAALRVVAPPVVDDVAPVAPEAPREVVEPPAPSIAPSATTSPAAEAPVAPRARASRARASSPPPAATAPSRSARSDDIAPPAASSRPTPSESLWEDDDPTPPASARAPAPKPSAETSAAAAGPSVTVVDTMIRSNRNVKTCFADEKGRSGELPSVAVKITMQPTGRVTAANIPSGPWAASDLDRCLSGAIQSIVFPPFSGQAVNLTYPFQF